MNVSSPFEFMQRIIFHIDMNSYFATCEQQANPFLRGKPLGICEHLGGILIAASVEAKKLGITTGTPRWEAEKIYPKIILIPTDPEKYRAITHKFLQVLYEYTENIEKYSIDEAFIDMTEDLRKFEDPWKEAERIGAEIKEKIKARAGQWMRCSVGIGESKLIAKIGSDLQKPDGLTVIRPGQKDIIYDKLSLQDVPGIGRRTAVTLQRLGILTLRDLRDYPESKLIALFGIRGYHLHKMGQLEGSWNEGFGEKDEEIKSMGHAYTLPKMESDRRRAVQLMYKLSDMVGRRLRESGFMGNIVHFVVTDKKGVTYDKRKKLSRYVRDGREIFKEALAMFEAAVPQSAKFKLVGVTVAGLVPESNQQELFDADKKWKELTPHLDKINDKYGDFTISPTPILQAQNFAKDSIGFGRMKEFKVKYKMTKS